MPLPIPDHPFRAFLFDCDGTIADSMPLHFIAWNRALARFNCPFPEDLFYAWGGLPVAQIIETLNTEHGLNMPVSEIEQEKEQMYLDALPHLQAIPEVLEHIHQSHGRIPFAVVSGSRRASVEASLVTLGISDRFDTLVCAGDYSRAKPDPEPFLLAAQRLNVAPADCLVFEDAEPGIQSAIAAGMQYVRVPNPKERAQATLRGDPK